MSEWDVVIRTASKWLSDNAPVCRGFSGVEPWARGDSPVKLLVARRPITKDAVPADNTSGSARQAEASSSSSKQTRSAFGCDACKKRKIKCDEGRPTCTNCSASSRKRARRCVYAYDFIARPPSREAPARDQAERAASTPAAGSSGGMSSDGNPEPALPPPTAGTTTVRPDLKPGALCAASTSSSIARLVPQTVDAEVLSHLVDTHGLTWFINATEVVEKQFLASSQRRAFTEYRQAVLERCWNAYINYQGKLPLSLPNTPSVAADTPESIASAVGSMIELPGLSSLVSARYVEAVTPAQVADLTQAALLHSFVSMGAIHYAYWAERRGEPSEEHWRGGASLIQLSTNALLQVMSIQDRMARGTLVMAPGEDDWEEEIEAKLLMALCLATMYRICAADPLGPATLMLECEWVAGKGGPAAMIKGVHPTPAQQELISLVLTDGIYALTQGKPSFLPPDPEWLETIPIAHRIIPEAFGVSLEMAKYILETIAVLYGPDQDDRAERLQALYRTLTSSLLVDIYASAHPARVQTGDLLYRQALICLVCLDGLGLAADDSQLVAASDAILELYAEAVYGDIFTVRWMLPLLMGGGLAQKLSAEEEASGERDRRAEAGRIFDAMADTCGLADIEAARLVTQKMWERRDAGKPWRLKETMREENLELLLV